MGELADTRKKTLFEVLSRGMDNTNGKENYSEWIKELTTLFGIAYEKELKNGKYSDGVTSLPSGIALYSSSPYYFYNWNYVGGSDVRLLSNQYSLNLINGTKNVQPDDIINVRFGREFDFATIKTESVVAMPAFCLVYLLNHEQDALKARVAGYIISATSIYGAGRTLIVTLLFIHIYLCVLEKNINEIIN